MHMRKFLYLLIIDVFILFCSTYTKEESKTIIAKDANKHYTNKSAYIENFNQNSNATKQAKEVRTIGVTTTYLTTRNTTRLCTNETTTSKSITSTTTTEQTTTLYMCTKTEELNETTEDYIQENLEENTQVNIQEVEPETESNLIESDYIVIKENVIPIVYGIANQSMVDAHDVVQDTGLIQNTNNTFLFGHSNRSFSILDKIVNGEIITINNYGTTRNYQVQIKELGVLSEEGREVILLSNGSNVVYRDYGFPALILITCANGYDWNYRWIIVAKELE